MKCSHCKKEYPKEELHINATGKNGSKYYWCRKCNRDRCRNYRGTIKGKESIRLAVKKYELNNKNKRRCWYLASWALKTGKIKKSPCFICGSKKSIKHHPDYRSPRKIIWLCRTHHTLVHHNKIKIAK